MVAEYLPPVEDESSERGPLAVRVARRIHQDVISAGWPVGEVLGSEEQLQKRYAVGRSVLREAVRLLEFEGVARRRPGPGGGLVVTAPDPDSVVRSARVFLDHRGVRGEHLFAAWSALELAAVEVVVRNLDEQGIARLRGAVAHEREQALPGGPDGRSGLHAEIATNVGKSSAGALSSGCSDPHAQARTSGLARHRPRMVAPASRADRGGHGRRRCGTCPTSTPPLLRATRVSRCHPRPRPRPRTAIQNLPLRRP